MMYVIVLDYDPCDYDWISIFDVMDCMFSVWGSLEFAPKCQKLVDKGKSKKLATHGA